MFSSAAPASPPTNITGRATDSTTIVLYWYPPLPGDQNGIIRSYNISVIEEDTGRKFSRTSVNTEESFHSLHPFYIYSVTITATTVAPGPPSTSIIVQTEEDSKYGYPRPTVTGLTSPFHFQHHSSRVLPLTTDLEMCNGKMIKVILY